MFGMIVNIFCNLSEFSDLSRLDLSKVDSDSSSRIIKFFVSFDCVVGEEIGSHFQTMQNLGWRVVRGFRLRPLILVSV